MTKEKFSHDIPGDRKALFDQMAEDLGTLKRRLLERMIEAFSAFPEDLQRDLLSAKPETRERALAALRAVVVHRERGKKAGDFS